jgi:site-specific DNA-methyltransferase (adenine-specific)
MKIDLDLTIPNQVLKGNCFDLLPQLPSKFFDLVVTDPPFFVMNKKNIKFKHRTDIIQSASFDGFASYEEFLVFTKSWLKLIQSHLKTDASVYIFFGAQFISDLYHMAINLGFKYKGIQVWHKTNPVPKIRKNGYLSSTELVLFLQQGNPVFNFLGQKAMHNFIETPICMRPERLRDKNPIKKNKHPTLHPTQKPEKVLEKFIRVSSKPGDWVLDPFVGTGTTNAVCQNLNRKCIGIELNETYVSAAKERIKKPHSLDHYI